MQNTITKLRPIAKVRHQWSARSASAARSLAIVSVLVAWLQVAIEPLGQEHLWLSVVIAGLVTVVAVAFYIVADAILRAQKTNKTKATEHV